jgi:hypothetical protein
MRTRTFATLTVTAVAVAVALAGCGGGTQFANKPRPAAPINLSVYVNDARVSVSPDTVGAGQIIFIVTNQASNTESLSIHPSGSPGQSLASTGPINPQATAQVTVDLGGPRDYTIAAGKAGSNEAARAGPSPIQPGSLHVGKPRPSASHALLQP